MAMRGDEQHAERDAVGERARGTAEVMAATPAATLTATVST